MCSNDCERIHKNGKNKLFFGKQCTELLYIPGEQYIHKYWIYYFIRRFILVVNHRQVYKYTKIVRKKK